MKLAGFSIYRYELPLSEPLRLKGRELHHREGLLVELASGGGVAGWGEAAPLPGFSREGLDEVIWQLRGLASSMMGREVTEDILDSEGALPASWTRRTSLRPRASGSSWPSGTSGPCRLARHCLSFSRRARGRRYR